MLKRGKFSTEHLLGYLWLCVLGGALACAALSADRQARQVEEYPFGCDSFGYLRMAQEVRRAAAARTWPQFGLETPHTQLLVEWMQAHHAPFVSWGELVAPHAHHYFPRAGRVGPQYPPGTALLLALFPEGAAVHRLNRVVIGLFLVAGLCLLFVAAGRRAWFAAGCVTLALGLGLEIIGRIGNWSFSINAVLAPLLLTSLGLAACFRRYARGQGKSWQTRGLALLAGLAFGLAVLVRLPVALMLPGLLVLLWPGGWRDQHKGALVAFGCGVGAGGVLPVLAHQQRLTGAWYLPTYGAGDSAPPTLEALRQNLSFYLGAGPGGVDNWALIVMLAGCLGLSLWLRRGAARLDADEAHAARPALSWRRLMLAALLVWGVPTGYFLTHTVVAHYYSIPATFGAALLVALGALAIESNAVRTTWHAYGSQWRLFVRVCTLILALTPGLVAIGRAWANYVPATAETAPRHFVLPAELADERAWLWADNLTGTIWYYARRPAYKILFSDTDTRLLAYRLAWERGEPQYIIRDGDAIQPMLDEIGTLGGTLEQRGEVDHYPYFLIRWPPAGPQRR